MSSVSPHARSAAPSSAAALAASRSSFEGKRVCITGGRGALGRPLVSALLAQGVDRIATLGRQSPETIAAPLDSPSVRHFVGNILDPDAVDAAFRGCSVVFHLAALGPAECVGAHMVRAYQVNTHGAVHVLDACARAGVSRLIYASTALVYGEPRFLPVTEDHPTAPASVYAASKLAAEVALQGAAHRLGVRCDIARLSCVYGASFDATTLVGRAVSQAASARAIVLRGLDAVHDFLHEDDAALALMALAASDGEGPAPRIVNVSSGTGVSVGDLARTLAKVASESGLGAVSVTESAATVGAPAPDFVVDNRRLRQLASWEPSISLADGLRRSLQAWIEASAQPDGPLVGSGVRTRRGSHSL